MQKQQSSIIFLLGLPITNQFMLVISNKRPTVKYTIFNFLLLLLQVFHLSAFWFGSIGIIGVIFNIFAICVILLNEKVSFQQSFFLTTIHFCSYWQISTCWFWIFSWQNWLSAQLVCLWSVSQRSNLDGKWGKQPARLLDFSWHF